MGKLFKSWFKKKKSQESIIHPTLEAPFQKQQLSLTNTKLYTPDETPLTFTHGSLLDDVLNGLKDHHEHSKINQDAPDSPLSTSVRHLDSWSKIGTVPEQQNQQKQIFGESYGNNGSSAHQQNKVSQSILCSPPSTPETISDAFSTPPPPSTKAMAPPGSAATPSSATPLSSSASLTPPSLMQGTLHHENNLATSLSPTNDQVDHLEESNSDPDTVESNDMTPNRYHHYQQQQSNMANTQQQDIQQRRMSSIKSPSIASSHESNQDKRNQRYSQVSGVSMSRMKERHRQECRRSMQSTGQPQQPPDSYLHQPSASHHPSFQSTPLVNQQQQQQKKSHPKPQQQNRHLIASPSMTSIYPVEPMSLPPHPLSQQHHPIPAAINSATSYSFPPPPPSPANTMSMARSSSLMTDIHYQQQSTPGGNIGTMAMSPLTNDLMHPSPSWRQQPLFPYQSDIILPPYNPSQLGTFQQQQQQIMQPPYRAKQALLPRSASVYGNVNQYHYKHHSPHDIHYGSGVLLRSPTMDFNGSRKSTHISTRPYQPQLLSLSTQPPSDQSHVSKKQPEDSLEMSASLPPFYLPSSSSPSKTPTPSKQQQTPVSSSSSSIMSSVCTTPTNNSDQKVSATISDGTGDDPIGSTNAMDQVGPRRVSTSKSSNKNGLDETSRSPTPATATSAAEEESNLVKKKHRRQRRRYSLPTTIPTLSSSRPSSIDSEKDKSSNNEKDQVEEKDNTTPPSLQTENLGKLEIENYHCQHRHHSHHHQSACSSSTNSSGMHLCNGGICSSSASPVAPCCPNTPLSPSAPTCQSSHHHHRHHPHSHYPPPHQYYVDHLYPCTHTLPPPPPPLPPPLPSCCPPPSCCSPRPHHHHHHHHRRDRRHHRHHSSTKQQQMRKSKSCMTKAAMENDNDNDDDDTLTIGSASPTKSKHHDAQQQKQQRRQRHHLSMPTSQSMIHPIHTSADDNDNDDDDDHTVNGEDETTTTTGPDMKKSASMQQKPFLRSLLPRAPRFTSLPRALQDQQQQQGKTKLTTSKSSYSWMPSRA